VSRGKRKEEKAVKRLGMSPMEWMEHGWMVAAGGGG
jgi:hypothetical protein